MLSNTVLTILLGSVAGLFGGALGQSGAETMLPGLLILGIVSDFKTAAGTVLLTILPPLSLLAIVEYYKRGQVRVVTSMILMGSYFFAAYAGAYATRTITNSQLQFISAIYFFVIGGFFLWNSYTGTYGEQGFSTMQSHGSAVKHIVEHFHGKSK
jgi:uncharacterized membrane protein YfcA